jgi:hypothetical protein
MKRKEQWCDVAGYQGWYQVSNFGRIRSLHHGQSRVLKTFTPKNCYVQVTLYNEGIKILELVHRLVAEAFISNPTNLPEVHHKDGIKTNNRWSNLEWISVPDHRRNQPYAKGSQQGNAKLTESNVAEIRRLCAEGLTHRTAANRFHVCRSAITMIVNRKNWRHI